MKDLPSCIKKLYMDNTPIDPTIKSEMMLKEITRNPKEIDAIFEWAMIVLSYTPDNEYVIMETEKYLPLTDDPGCRNTIIGTLVNACESLNQFEKADKYWQMSLDEAV